MKVKELIERLSEFNEDSEVEFEAWLYDKELYVNEVKILKRTSDGVEKAVIIDLEIT